MEAPEIIPGQASVDSLQDMNNCTTAQQEPRGTSFCGWVPINPLHNWKNRCLGMIVPELLIFAINKAALIHFNLWLYFNA